MDNLSVYNKVRTVPKEAQKPITGGRIGGMTDINPMWRIKMLTELFGPCGVGWKYTITEKRLENGSDGQIAAFVDVDLYIKHEGEWSEPIPGTGGNMFLTKERNGVHTSDECFKMALTDALSVACKALGFGGDIYWQKDPTKYDKAPVQQETIDPRVSRLHAVGKAHGFTPIQIAAAVKKKYGKTVESLSETECEEVASLLSTPKQSKPDSK